MADAIHSKELMHIFRRYLPLIISGEAGETPKNLPELDYKQTVLQGLGTKMKQICSEHVFRTDHRRGAAAVGSSEERRPCANLFAASCHPVCACVRATNRVCGMRMRAVSGQQRLRSSVPHHMATRARVWAAPLRSPAACHKDWLMWGSCLVGDPFS